MSKQSLLSQSPPVEQLSVDQLKAVMPNRQKQNITQGLVNELNGMIEDPQHQEYFRDNILGFADVLKDSNTTLPGYIKAVKYVGFLMMGMVNQVAWVKTFPERYERLITEKKDPAYIRSLVCAYNKGKLVNTIREQAMIPAWLYNQDTFQKAINAQAVLMTGAKSEMVRTQAANSILTHLKRPEAAKVEIDMTVHQDDTIEDLKKVMVQLAEAQQQAVADGTVNAKDIAESDIINGESKRIDQ